MRADDYFNGWVEEKTGKEEADGHTLYAEQLKGEDKKKKKKRERNATTHCTQRHFLFWKQKKKKKRGHKKYIENVRPSVDREKST